MYLIFYGYGQYKIIAERENALEFSKLVGVTWIEEDN
jgi:hypothetical protein